MMPESVLLCMQQSHSAKSGMNLTLDVFTLVNLMEDRFSRREYALDHVTAGCAHTSILRSLSYIKVVCSHLTHNKTLGCHLGFLIISLWTKETGRAIYIHYLALESMEPYWGIFESPNQLVCRHPCRLWRNGRQLIKRAGEGLGHRACGRH